MPLFAAKRHSAGWIFLFFCIIIAHAVSQDIQSKQLAVRLTTGQIKLDGRVDSLWSDARFVTDFQQMQPYYGQPPSRKTAAGLLTTQDALYCLIIAYDERQNIQSNRGMFDEFGGDVVSLMLDTFNDQRTAYKFAVSASGVRSDCRLLDDARNRDYSWDGIWFAATKIYSWGYVVEMKIPYKSIQYDKTLQYWGLDFDRWIPASNEDLYWCKYAENEGQRISKFGKLRFEEFRPEVTGLNLEIYPAARAQATYLDDHKYDIDPFTGVDIFYNPSSKLTFQLTANPDFAQIEADPFDFNISRYETYFKERRPFFTKGNEVFLPAGKLRGSGFYTPLELFYSRRIGKKLADGSEVPILLGSKAFGRAGDWEYGGFVALTGKESFLDENSNPVTEKEAFFASARIKKQVFGNSSVGLLYVGKHTTEHTHSVIDVDGAFRTSHWQLAYQLAHSFIDGKGDLAGAVGFTNFGKNWINLVKGRHIGSDFNIDEIGFVPWQGNSQLVALTGPRWYFDDGYLRQMLIYGGGVLNYEKPDAYTDKAGMIGLNMQFRNNWGYEINIDYGKSKEEDITFNSYSLSLSSWYHISPKWEGSLWGGHERTYNFSRDYQAYYSYGGAEIKWLMADVFEIGSSADMFIEWNPDREVEEITYNARPYFSLTPVNNLNVRLYADNVYRRSSDRLDQFILGFLFSYNYSPKSWIYFAVNEIRDRDYVPAAPVLYHKRQLRIADQVAVFKLSYLYYF